MWPKTHYHSRHISVVAQFTASEKVRRVLLPYPENEADAWIMLQLADALAESEISCEIIAGESVTLLGNTSFSVSALQRLDRSNHPVISFSLSCGEEKLTYLSASSWEASYPDLISLLNDSNVLLFGAHGPVVKTPFELPDNCKNIETIAIFDESYVKYISGIDKEDCEEIMILTGEGVYKAVFSKE